MKGFINELGVDIPPCGTCKHKDKMVVESPCYNCIDVTDLALHKPNNETEFANYARRCHKGITDTYSDEARKKNEMQ